MEKKAFVCKIAKGEEVLVFDIIGAEHAEAALQESVSRHRVKLSRAGAAASFGEPQMLSNNSASFKNGSTSFSSELLADVLKRLKDADVATLGTELRALSQAMARFERSLKK